MELSTSKDLEKGYAEKWSNKPDTKNKREVNPSLQDNLMTQLLRKERGREKISQQRKRFLGRNINWAHGDGNRGTVG